MLLAKNRADGVGWLIRLVLAVAGPAAVLGCGSDDDDEPSMTVYEDRGKVCIESEDDGAVRVLVEFPTCLSSSCDQVKERTCSVAVTSEMINITSRGVVEHRGTDCTSDCGIFTTECRSEAVEAGTYSIVHGEDSAGVTLPTDAMQVLGDGMLLGGCE